MCREQIDRITKKTSTQTLHCAVRTETPRVSPRSAVHLEKNAEGGRTEARYNFNQFLNLHTNTLSGSQSSCAFPRCLNRSLAGVAGASRYASDSSRSLQQSRHNMPHLRLNGPMPYRRVPARPSMAVQNPFTQNRPLRQRRSSQKVSVHRKIRVVSANGSLAGSGQPA